MGQTGTAVALIPQDRNAPIGFITSQFVHYYTGADIGLADGVRPYLVTWPAGTAEADEAAAAMFFTQQEAQLPAREQRRRAAVSDAASLGALHPSFAHALASAAAGLGGASARIGFETLEADSLIASALPLASRVPMPDLARHLRLHKTAPEIALMRAASAVNVASGLATAAEMGRLGSLQAVRAAFNARVAAAGNTPVFMVVDGVIAPEYEAPLVPGRAALIDCVSHCEGYHGDFGRTVFLGEPPRAALAAAKQVAAAWDALRNELRPGMRFSQVRARGAELLKAQGSSLAVPFSPHVVGLNHTDQPKFDLEGKPIDHVLAPGMTISVDCPLMEVGSWGTLHLEDLTLITADGSTPLHDVGQQIIIA
jgi:Xaa-Pro aminopeptidase